MVKLEEEIRQEVMNEIDLSYDVSDEEILELIKEATGIDAIPILTPSLQIKRIVDCTITDITQ